MESRPLWSCWSCRFLLVLIFLTAALSCRLSLAKEVYLQQWQKDTPTPTFNLMDLEGRQWNIQSLRGKVVLLNFWASWCAPCVDELPLLNELATGSEAEKGNLIILGVNFKEGTPAIQRFMKEHGVRYPVVIDKTGEHFKKWTSGVMPTTILIGKDGRPRWRVVGELDPTDAGFRQALKKMLEEPHRQDALQARVVVK